MKSTHAAAAAAIRTELKKHGITARVRSRTASMMDAVDVTLTDCAPWTRKEVERFVGRFQYGHFDGMTDCYNYTNCREDLPQVKYAHVNAEYSPAVKQAAWLWLVNHYGIADAPSSPPESWSVRIGNDTALELLYAVLSGQVAGFWQKPRIRAAA